MTSDKSDYGCCYACEPTAIENEKLEAERDRLLKVVEVYEEALITIQEVDDSYESETWDIADQAIAKAREIMNGGNNG